MKHAIPTGRARGLTQAVIATIGALALLSGPAEARDSNSPSGGLKPAQARDLNRLPRGFKKVSSLVDLPSFMPGIGILYVKPDTLPAGPFLAYDRAGRRVSTIYMVPVDDIQKQKKFDLTGLKGENDHVSLYFNPGHAGVEMPHYHVVIWHVNKRGEARVAR